MRRRIRTAPLRLLIAALVLIGQAVLGPHLTTRTAAAELDGLSDVAPICHGAAPDSPASQDPAAPQRPDLGCVLCVLCQPPSAASILPGPPFGNLAAPSVIVSRAAPLPPARAPPREPLLGSAYPTGPPPRLA